MFTSDGNWHLTQVLMDESQFTLYQTAFTSMSVLPSAPRWVLIVQNSWEIKTGSPDRPHTEQVAEVLTRALASFSSRQQTRTLLADVLVNNYAHYHSHTKSTFPQNKCRICFLVSFIQLFFSISGGGGVPDASLTENVAVIHKRTSLPRGKRVNLAVKYWLSHATGKSFINLCHHGVSL